MTHPLIPLTLIVLLAACSAPGRSRSDDRGLRFTAIPDQNTTELQEKFRPLELHLTRALGTSVRYVPARDYQAAVEMFVNGDVGLAWYGGLTGVQARHRVPGASAIARGEEDAAYYSYFIAHRATELQPSSTFPFGIARHPFTFGSPQSTSGRLMPEYFIRQHTGKTPDEFFALPVGFSGSHDRTLELVASAQYPVGVVNYKVYEQRVREGKVDPAVVRVIWRTPTYADYNWTVRPDLDARFGSGFTERLTGALLEIQEPALLAALPRERLVPASTAEYDDLREVARQLDMLR
ncbi:MAG TPA: putative selenate ABC transporter substrate-binding protein [Vicinamibacterales bacterium]|nr:putative selenate ABC transporter substrate-binding protein [Vicinamibacterales bacterium]